MSFRLRLTVNATRGGYLCKKNVTTANEVTSGGCCTSGSSYAEGKGSYSNATCFRNLGFCGNNNWGTCLARSVVWELPCPAARVV